MIFNEKKTQPKGLFVTFEGIDGTGKTTQLHKLAAYLESTGIPVKKTREPGGTSISEQIRSLILDASTDMLPETELLLMFAARYQHIYQLIQSTMSKGIWVLCDRFTDATYAYQGGGGGIDRERIRLLESWVQDDFRPDVTFYLDAPVDIARTRVKTRADTPNRLDHKSSDFYEKVRSSYLIQAKAYPDRFIIIDASQTIERVFERICLYINELADQWQKKIPL